MAHYVILFDESGAAYRFYPPHEDGRAALLPAMVSFCDDLKAMQKGVKDVKDQSEIPPELLEYAQNM